MNTELREVDASTLNLWLADNAIELVDIRELDEYARENIPGSKLVPLSDIETYDFGPDNRNKKVVFHCAGGIRTAQAAAELCRTGFCEVYTLKDGIEGWKAAGLKTRFNKKAPISIMRQVQIIVGTSMLLGIVLGLEISPWFFGLSAVMGAGLLFAGISGTCAMANVLARLPYNQIKV
jgi:rhodanese-related sulfurtransferase